MNIWIVKTLYNYEGCGSTVKGFFDESYAIEFKETLECWLNRKPSIYHLDDGATSEQWNELIEKEDVWQAEHPGVSGYADGFVVECIEMVDTRPGFKLTTLIP